MTERIGRRIAIGAMDQVAERVEIPWWVGLAASAAAFIFASKKKRKPPKITKIYPHRTVYLRDGSAYTIEEIGWF